MKTQKVCHPKAMLKRKKRGKGSPNQMHMQTAHTFGTSRRRMTTFNKGHTHINKTVPFVNIVNIKLSFTGF